MKLSLIHKLLIILALLTASRVAYPAAVLLDDSKGLSNNVITDIMQDQKGILWIGTHSGLNTYDGYTFREIAAFRSTHINCIRYDKYTNRIWVGADNGLFYIDLNTHNIINCTAKSTFRSVVEIILQDGIVYVAFHGGSVLQIQQNNSSRVLYSTKKINKESLLTKGHIAAGKDYLYLAPTKSDVLVRLKIPAQQFVKGERINVSEIRSMFFSDSLFVINTEQKGISVLNTRSEKHLLSEIIAPLNKTRGSPEVAYVKNNRLYLAYKGLHWLYVINFLTGEVSKFNTDENQEILRTKVINCMYEDDAGVLWLGTTKGLIRLYEHPQFPFTPILSGAVSPVSIRQMVAGPPGYLFISTYNGLYKYNKQTQETVSIKKPDPVNYKDFPNYFRTLLYDTSGYLYAGTESREYFFFRYVLKHKRFEKDFYRTKSSNIQTSASYSLLKDRHNKIWIATDKGLASYDLNTSLLSFHQSDKFHAGSHALMQLCPSARQNYFWAGGKDGLFLVHIVNGVEERFNNTTQPALPDDEIIFVSEDPMQNVWIGYKKSGIYILDKNFQAAIPINKSNGLSSNEVYGILWQNKDTAWISTLNGLCCYAVRSKTFTNYFIENGLPDNEFNQNSFYADSNGDLYFGGVNGIVRFAPHRIAPQAPVTLYVSSVSKWDKHTQSFTDVDFNDATHSIAMSPSDHLLTFTFGLSDYTNTESNTYFYRIKGLYDEWISLGSQNILRLEGLPAGTFTIQVIAFNKRGMQSVNMLDYKIDIIQVFYKTWWFYLIFSLMVVLLVYLYFKWRLKNLQQLQKLRTQIASNLHDEVGSLLTSIIISTDSARYSSDDVNEKNSKLEKVAALSRDATNTMSDVLWSIDSRNDYAGNLTDRMREHAETMLLPLNIDLEFDFTETKQEQNIKPDTRQNLYLIFKESINNIAKHSKAAIVNVSYKQNGSQFEMIIQNDNPLPSETSVHQGQGLRNMKMRAKKIDADLHYEINNNWVTVHIRSK